MKTNIQKWMAGLFLVSLCACEDESAIFHKEQYENIIYIVSYSDNHIFEAEYELDGSNNPLSLPISYGGTKNIAQAVDVTVRSGSTDLFDHYNKVSFDLDTAKFAKLLTGDRYIVPNNIVTLRPGNEMIYSLMPVNIDVKVLDSLSPDSTYFISFEIESVTGGYRLEPERSKALYRVYKKNAYASTKGTEYYSFKGYKDNRYLTSSTKRIFPLTKDKVRMFVGTELFNAKTVTEQEIKQKSIVVQVHADNSLTVAPYDAEQMEVELLEPPVDDKTFLYTNTYDPETLTFQLYYRYRNYDASTGSWSDWAVIRERSMKNTTSSES